MRAVRYSASLLGLASIGIPYGLGTKMLVLPEVLLAEFFSGSAFIHKVSFLNVAFYIFL